MNMDTNTLSTLLLKTWRTVLPDVPILSPTSDSLVTIGVMERRENLGLGCTERGEWLVLHVMAQGELVIAAGPFNDEAEGIAALLSRVTNDRALRFLSQE